MFTVGSSALGKSIISGKEPSLANFSRSKLLDQVWGHGVYVEERTVDVHMSRLRKSLKSVSEDNLDPIRTVRDGGYGLLTNKII